MTKKRSTYIRVSRREMYSSRSLPAILLAVAVIVVCIWLITEVMLRFFGQQPLLVSPADIVGAVGGFLLYPRALVVTVGVVGVVVGLILFVAGVSAGRRSRHLIETDRAVTVVDDEVIASALARQAARAGNVDPDNARVTVSHRRAIVNLTPATGIPVNRASVVEAVMEQLRAYGLRPTLRPKVVIGERGRVGA